MAPGIKAFVVPGSEQVAAAAEAEGLDKVFRDAGFIWGEAACSMCASLLKLSASYGLTEVTRFHPARPLLKWSSDANFRATW